MSGWLDWLGDIFTPFVSITDQRSLFSFLGAYIFLFLVIIGVRIRRGTKEIGLKAVLKLAFDPKVWLHPSSKLDYKLYAINFLLLTFVLGVFMVGSTLWSEVLGAGLAALFGAPDELTNPGWALVISMVIVQILALDFGYWLGHYAFHRFEILWEFHKVHHSAEVMTPATEMRQHPVELVLIPVVIGMTTGLTYAVFTQLCGSGSEALGIVGTNMILVAHMLTFHHLRHSHINMPFTGILGHLLHSPAHHQIHHSDNPAHFDRNMGYLFSIWDWMAGTLYIPKPGERVTLGIGHEGKGYQSVGEVYWRPFIEAGRLVVRKLRPGHAKRL